VECRKLAERVDSIAEPFTGDRNFEFERAEVWQYVAAARSGENMLTTPRVQ
jgi:hypothetical protein